MVNNGRSIGGGRGQVRAILYIATVTAMRVDPQILTFYERLRQTGKPFEVAIMACVRKVFNILIAMMSTQSRWQQPILS